MIPAMGFQRRQFSAIPPWPAAPPPPAPRPGPWRFLLDNVIGTDAYTRYTAGYTWRSNQTAHAMFGFALFVVGFALWPAAGGPPHPALLLALGVPLAKDLVLDYLVELLPRRRAFALRRRDHLEILRDGLTDSLFYWLGAWLAAALLLSDGRMLLPAAATGAVLAMQARHYTRLWGRFDRADLPFYCRLVGLRAAGLDDDARSMIAAMARPGPPAAAVPFRLLLVAGPPQTGRTTIAAALACEHLVHGVQPRYFAGIQPFRDALRERGEARPTDPAHVARAQLVVIDDVGTEILGSLCGHFPTQAAVPPAILVVKADTAERWDEVEQVARQTGAALLRLAQDRIRPVQAAPQRPSPPRGRHADQARTTRAGGAPAETTL
jgi:hypothetical protein